jgi:uncharacterized protein involved in exopolysaccharide biosynthesis
MNGDAIISAPDANEEELNLGDLLGVLIENRWLIFGITLVAFLIGGYQAYTAVPIYQADGLLQVEEKYSGLSGFESSSMYEYYSPVNTEIEILRSRSVLGSVVNNLKLDIYAEPEYWMCRTPHAARQYGWSLSTRKLLNCRQRMQRDSVAAWSGRLLIFLCRVEKMSRCSCQRCRRSPSKCFGCNEGLL